MESASVGRRRCVCPPRLVRPCTRREVCWSYAGWLAERWQDGWLSVRELAELAGAVVRFMRGH